MSKICFCFLVLFLAAYPAQARTRADEIIVYKAERILILKSSGKEIKRYSIALGFSPVGAKEKEGDGKTPEGSYIISHKNNKSAFHLSLKISYPSKKDVAHAKNNGFNPGSDIMIHGLPNGSTDADYSSFARDWTLGCIAVSNSAIKEIWDLVDVGTVVRIYP